MSRRGHRAGPARVLSIAEIAEQAPFIRGVLRGLGVRAVDVDDVCQDVMTGAWTSSEAGRYRPDPARDARDAIQRWLFGVCLNYASHYRDRAFRRREVLVAEPWSVASEPRDTADPGDRLDAECALLGMWELPFWAREVLILAALGHGPTEIAAKLGIPLGTASSRMRLARTRLARKLRRRR
ncbi:sigma-70 family RNA polymerase sigma factor [Sorangium sp. So ce1036]|uniref:RNA polymerase sigma factor n=1 Tax=Sorangium sp. So ce1036 TaxID=3133328 RepID=UPI003F1059FD